MEEPHEDETSELLILEHSNIPNTLLWTEESTQLMVTLFMDYYPRVGSSIGFRTKKKMWEAIKIEMSKAGYNFSSIQIENRWKSVNRCIKRWKIQKETKYNRTKQLLGYEKDLFDFLTKNGELRFTNEDEIFRLKTEEVDIKISEASLDDLIQSIPVTANFKPTANKKIKIDSSNLRNEQWIEEKESIATELRQIKRITERYYRQKLELKKKQLSEYTKRTRIIQTNNILFRKMIQRLNLKT